jgi:general stress protein 26
MRQFSDAVQTKNTRPSFNVRSRSFGTPFGCSGPQGEALSWGLRRCKFLGATTMTKPQPEKIDPARVTELARGVVAADRFPMLASIDGDQPRLRPVSPVKTDGFTIYVANLRQYHKTAEIAANPKVELCYMDEQHNQVRITGVAETVNDRVLLQEIWDANPLLRQYLGSLDNPDLIVYCIRPGRVRYMQEWALEYYDVPLE